MSNRLRFHGTCCTIIAPLFATVFFCGAASAEQPVAPGKFIPTFAIKYGGVEGWPPADVAARFDLLVVSSSVGHARVHRSEAGNTWQTLKRRNPHLKVFLYKNGPTLYNVAAWGELGRGWQWIKQEHGPGSTDRWTAVAIQYGGCLQGKPYTNERLVNVGNRNWVRYWAEETHKKYWTGEEPPGRLADGLFADNCGYRMPWRGQWHLEGHPDKPDQPIEYTRNGEHQPELYKRDIQAVHRWLVPWLAERSKQLVLNFGNMVRDPESWAELDRQPHPVFAAMEEGAFVHPWGKLGRAGNFVFWPEQQWLNQVHAMRRLRHVRALMNVHGHIPSKAEGLNRMDAVDASGHRCWDVVWYALASFLMGYDDVRQNAYMNFTVWGYSRFYWLDEFNPKYLHLGNAVGEMQKVAGRQGAVYLREFEDGWVAVNPTRQDAAGVKVPRGQARVLNHGTFKRPERVPLVNQFDLPVHCGVVLLKPDRHPGNVDNR